MTPADRIEHCDQCGWIGEVTERCPDCELDERIRAADAVEIWAHACELAEIVRNSLFVVPDTFKASLVLHNWEVTKDAIANP